MIENSSSVSFPGLVKTASGISNLPRSCSNAPVATCRNEQQSDAVLAGKFPTRASAFECGLGQVALHAIRIFSAALALTPHGRVVLCEHPPLRRGRQSPSCLCGGLVGSESEDLVCGVFQILNVRNGVAVCARELAQSSRGRSINLRRRLRLRFDCDEVGGAASHLGFQQVKQNNARAPASTRCDFPSE